MFFCFVALRRRNTIYLNGWRTSSLCILKWNELNFSITSAFQIFTIVAESKLALCNWYFNPLFQNCNHVYFVLEFFCTISEVTHRQIYHTIYLNTYTYKTERKTVNLITSHLNCSLNALKNVRPCTLNCHCAIKYMHAKNCSRNKNLVKQNVHNWTLNCIFIDSVLVHCTLE